jgi:hypothetical protein
VAIVLGNKLLIIQGADTKPVAEQRMKTKILFLLFLGPLQLVSLAHAEGGCPPGQYPQEGQGWRTCVPVPGANNAQQPLAAPPPRWEDHWQAIATDKQKAVIGTSINNSSSDDSAQAAVSDCHAKGGVSCEVQITYRNGCVAMVVGKSLMNTQGESTLAEAEKSALAKCNEADTNCRVYYSSCNLPVRVQ